MIKEIVMIIIIVLFPFYAPKPFYVNYVTPDTLFTKATQRGYTPMFISCTEIPYLLVYVRACLLDYITFTEK